MTLRTRRICFLLGAFALLSLLAVTGAGYYLLSPNSSRNRAAAVDCTLQWGRLAPFPASTRQLVVRTEGSMFTRAFRVTFLATPSEIERWLELSPGIHEKLPNLPVPGVRHFSIVPGGGAQHAEVTVDDAQHRVIIYVSWS